MQDGGRDFNEGKVREMKLLAYNLRLHQVSSTVKWCSLASNLVLLLIFLSLNTMKESSWKHFTKYYLVFSLKYWFLGQNTIRYNSCDKGPSVYLYLVESHVIKMNYEIDLFCKFKLLSIRNIFEYFVEILSFYIKDKREMCIVLYSVIYENLSLTIIQ